ncbi:Calx-beta domain-containing protein [Kribbella sp. NPDC056951]|uniref:Calx-beta domain-containing protein n=1 Tax=Kribbella sp. NPDC056951 TaxID=3345978 RepID=UPI003633201B
MRVLGTITLGMAAALAIGPVVASAAPPPSPVVEGNSWVVQQVPAGYRVTLRLDKPVAMRAARPLLAVNGKPVGVARQSADGRTLTLVTTDKVAAHAHDVQLTWPGDQRMSVRALAGGPTDAYWLNARKGPLLKDDPGKPGKYKVETAEYNLGDEAVLLPGLGQKSEVVGKVYAPVGAAGKRPLVVFLHGRHESCYGDESAPSDKPWPCPKGTKSVPSYRGYDGPAKALASSGYQVVSISANAVNAFDFDAYDGGAQARAELVLDHLKRWRQWSTIGGGPFGSKYIGKIDLQNVGLMGHSRGGEGVARAAVVNADRGGQFGIRAVLPLAPVDFARSTVPGVAMSVLLPYCDGDVSDLQGQKFYDDTRNSITGDGAARSTVTVLGANHNFFNTEWTPGQSVAPSFDDWGGEGTKAPCDAKYAGRLKAKEQQAVGTAYVAGFFRLQLGHEKQFLPLFDGSDSRTASAGKAVVRVVAQAPLASRRDVTAFDKALPKGALSGKATAVVCAGETGKSACLTTTGAGDAPHWDPAAFASHAPTLAVTKLSWTDKTGVLRLNLPTVQRDVRKYAALSFRAAPDPTSTPKADLTVRVVDGRGRAASVPVSTVSDALVRMPGNQTAGLPKNLLRTVRIPLSSLKGVDLRDVRAIELRTDRVAKGSAYLSDLSFSSPGIGVSAPTVKAPKVTVSDVTTKEGDKGTTYADFVVRLSRPTTRPVVVYAETSLPFAEVMPVGDVAKAVVFKPGQVRQTVRVPIKANTRDSYDVKFDLALAAPREALLAKSFGHGLVLDDDPSPKFTVGKLVTTEGKGEVRFPVKLSAPSDKHIGFGGLWKDGAAVLGKDYRGQYDPPEHTLTGGIEVAKLEGELTVTVTDDKVKEPTETFTAFLDTVDGIDGLQLPIAATGTILDND